MVGEKERVLFIGTQFSNLYTAVDTPAKGRVDDDVQSAYLELLEEAVVEMMLKKGLFGPTADQGLMPVGEAALSCERVGIHVPHVRMGDAQGRGRTLSLSPAAP